MKKILLLGVILAAVLVAGCNKDEGYDSLESLTYTARISDTQTYSYRFISESRYEYVMTSLSTDGEWIDYVKETGSYTYEYPSLEISYPDEHSIERYTVMTFHGKKMFKDDSEDYSWTTPDSSIIVLRPIRFYGSYEYRCE